MKEGPQKTGLHCATCGYQLFVVGEKVVCLECKKQVKPGENKKQPAETNIKDHRKATQEDCMKCNEPPNCSTYPNKCNINLIKED